MRQAAPLSPQLLNKIYDLLDLNTPVDAVLWALLLLAFFTLSRKSNLVVTSSKPVDVSKQLCRSDVLVCENGLLVQFHCSKTIQFGGRVLLVPVLAIPNSVLCPLRAYGLGWTQACSAPIVYIGPEHCGPSEYRFQVN